MAAKKNLLDAAQRHEKKGDLGKAVELFSEHLAANPTDLRSRLRLAELQERLGQAREATESFRRVGDGLKTDGHLARSAAAFRRALALTPHDVSSAMLLSDVLVAEGQRREAAEVLDGAARAAGARREAKVELALLERMATVDATTTAVLRFAEALKAAGDKPRAAAQLRTVADSLRQESAAADRLRVLEMLSELVPADVRVAVEAAKAALEFRDAHRALTLVRRALDAAPDDLELTWLAALGLEMYGDQTRSAQVFREAATRFAAAGRAERAREAWLGLLRVAPQDEMARTAIAPSLVPNLPRLLSRRSAALADVGAAEMDDALSLLDTAPARPAPLPSPAGEGDELAVSLDELATGAPLRIVADPAGPLGAAPPEPATTTDEQQPQATFPTLDATSRAIAPQPPVGAWESPIEPPDALPRQARESFAGVTPTEPRARRPMPARVLVVGDDPEAGWARQALYDLGLDVMAVSSQQLAEGMERAMQAQRELVFAPAPMQPLFAETGPWLVAGPTWVDRLEGRSRAQEAGLTVVEAWPITSPGDLTAAIERLGTPLALVGRAGAPVRISSPTVQAFQLALARQRLGAELLAEREHGASVSVVVASDGREAVVLGEFGGTSLDDWSVVASPSPQPGEAARLELARSVALAAARAGVFVVRLVSEGDRWAYESFEDSWGPGGLAVEARCGLSLVSLAVDLARGEPAPPLIECRGTATAGVLPASSLGALANLRLESGDDGRAFLCAQAADLAQASRRLLRGRKPGAPLA